MNLIEKIKCDMVNGTPGPWTAPSKPVFGDYCGSYVPHDWDGNGRLAVFHVTAGPEHAAPNTRRIARVPDMEAALLAAEELADAVDEWGAKGRTEATAAALNTALGNYRAAMEAAA